MSDLETATTAMRHWVSGAASGDWSALLSMVDADVTFDVPVDGIHRRASRPRRGHPVLHPSGRGAAGPARGHLDPAGRSPDRVRGVRARRVARAALPAGAVPRVRRRRRSGASPSASTWPGPAASILDDLRSCDPGHHPRSEMQRVMRSRAVPSSATSSCARAGSHRRRASAVSSWDSGSPPARRPPGARRAADRQPVVHGDLGEERPSWRGQVAGPRALRQSMSTGPPAEHDVVGMQVEVQPQRSGVRLGRQAAAGAGRRDAAPSATPTVPTERGHQRRAVHPFQHQVGLGPVPWAPIERRDVLHHRGLGVASPPAVASRTRCPSSVDVGVATRGEQRGVGHERTPGSSTCPS